VLDSFISHVRDQVSQNIKKVIGHSNQIEKAMAYSAISESKMIRAGLIFASGKLNPVISNKALLTLATSIELIHTYSLIHDDLPCMDDDDLRRGKDSNHIVYGEADAVLAGDALQTLAYEIICNEDSLSSKDKVKAIKLISEACGKNGMVFGQHLDVKNESKNIDEVLIEKIHELKTGKLIVCSIMLGQIGNNDKLKKNILESFGEKIGLAFQITDDILEITSDKITLGKNINSDSKNFKSTYVNVVGLENAIQKSIGLSKSAIIKLKTLQSKDLDILLELAEYITYREK